MPYNKDELLKLPVQEKQALAEELRNNINEDLLPVTEDEIAFAKERLKLHEENPADGMSWEELRKKSVTIMAFKLVIKPVALLDVYEAIDWYENESCGLGKRFFRDFEAGKEKFLSAPERY